MIGTALDLLGGWSWWVFGPNLFAAGMGNSVPMLLIRSVPLLRIDPDELGAV